jgi:hypothetical protein
MNEPENFIARWSRRKRDAAEAERQDEIAPQQDPAQPAEAPKGAENEPFDLASLPSIESIGADTDVTAFLRPGVPPELTREALRRAWSSDPAIRDFVGLVENGWDFNDPNGIPGFGSIAAGDVAQLLTRVIGTPAPTEPDAPQQVALAQGNSEQNPPQTVDSEKAQELLQDQPAPKQEFAAPEENDSVQRNEDDVAAQDSFDDPEDLPPSRRRGHGGALPKL